MRMPPAISMGASVSDSSTTAIAAARNGWRFAASVARAGPIRSSDRNHSSFVRTSGPRVANTSSAQTSQPRSQSWLRELRHGRQRDPHPCRAEDDRADPARRVTAHQRRHQHRVPGPGRRGEHAEEHAAGVAREPRPSRARRARRRRRRASAPAQNRGGSVSVRSASPASAAKIGVAPRISPSTDADDLSSAYTKPIWFT